MAEVLPIQHQLNPIIMRWRTFMVPSDLMLQFASTIEEYNLENVIEGSNEDKEEIELRIEYESDQKKLMHKLQDLIDEYYDENGDNDDDDDDDD